MNFPIFFIWMSPLQFYGASGVIFHFLIKLISANRIATDGTSRHICGYSVCLCPIKRTPGLYKFALIHSFQRYSCKKLLLEWGSSPTRVAMLCPLARHIYLPKVLVIPRKWWLCPNMTEKLFTGTLSIKPNQNFLNVVYSFSFFIYLCQNL